MTLRTRITLLTLALLAFSLLLIGTSVYGLLWGILYRNLWAELNETSLTSLRLLQEKATLTDLPASIYAQAKVVATFDNRCPSYENLELSTIPLPASLAVGSGQIGLTRQAYDSLCREDGQGLRLQTALRLTDQSSIPLAVVARLRVIPIPFGSPPASYPVIVMVGKSVEPIEGLLADFARTYTATALLVLIFGGFLASRLVANTLEPLTWVAKKAEEVSDKPTKLPEVVGNNEVSSLVRALNQMLARLDNAWETQGRFLADASHELRTPVTAMLGHVGYLLRRTTMTEQQRESLEIIKREGERMQKLVGDLLELSKTGGSWKVELGPVHLATLLHEIQEEYGKSCPIELEVPDRLWATGDPERLHQVIANLVSNAIKAGSTRVRLVARDLTERAVIRVEDNGEGIPPESLPHLFERFYRVDKSRDRERGGSGLGLAIVRSIVEAHGGTVWAESQLGKGSTFSVSLRRAEAPKGELA